MGSSGLFPANRLTITKGHYTSTIDKRREGCVSRGSAMTRRLAVLVRCLALTMLGAQAFADPTLRHFDIQTQATASALNEFARQADITLVFASALVDKRQLAGIKGDFTILEALKKLLDGTGLSFTQVSATTIAISAENNAAEPQHPPASGPGTVPDPTGNGNQTKGEDNMKHRGLFTRIAGLFALSGAILAGGHAHGQDTTGEPAGGARARAPQPPPPRRDA